MFLQNFTIALYCHNSLTPDRVWVYVNTTGERVSMEEYCSTVEHKDKILIRSKHTVNEPHRMMLREKQLTAKELRAFDSICVKLENKPTSTWWRKSGWMLSLCARKGGSCSAEGNACWAAGVHTTNNSSRPLGFRNANFSSQEELQTKVNSS